MNEFRHFAAEAELHISIETGWIGGIDLDFGLDSDAAAADMRSDAEVRIVAVVVDSTAAESVVVAVEA